MIAFDTTFLLDYLDGEPAVKSFLEDYVDKPFYAPAIVLFEIYRGSARIGGAPQVETVRAALDWIDPLALTDGAAREAALIEAELRAAGTPVNLGDTLIAGICRHNGATVVTRDSRFDHVDDLPVATY